MAFLDSQPAPRFWNRKTLWFALGGGGAYLASHWLFEIRSLPVTGVVTLARILIGAWPAAQIARVWGWRFRGSWRSLALAAPYPLDFARLVYFRRLDWLPRSLVFQMSGPTTYLIFLAAILLASRYVTDWAIRKAGHSDETVRRRLGTLLFLLTAASVVLVPSSLSVWSLKYVVDPVAVIGYCAIVGSSMAKDSLTR